MAVWSLLPLMRSPGGTANSVCQEGAEREAVATTQLAPAQTKLEQHLEYSGDAAEVVPPFREPAEDSQQHRRI
jgi:hypothetical protein